MVRVQTTLGEFDYRDLRILAYYKQTTISALVREMIKESLDNVKAENREYFQNARRFYNMMEYDKRKV